VTSRNASINLSESLIMSLITTIGDELKAAMKSGDAKKRDTLRYLQSALKNTAIEKRVSVAELSDTAVQDVVKRLVKQRKDSIDQYRAGGRADLVANEEAELAIISVYLPVQLSREATVTLVDRVVASLGTVTAKDMGRIMGMVMTEAAGQADGALVRELVAAKLR
jgi:uncharacterized protein